ncbi:autotransporter-associated beta strand repeat-containing protein [Nitratireductor aquimarinus]|nr:MULTISPECIES: autotransporter-associated beta strand repeat-containing protein [Alphaproteobacteria]MBN7759357.1 autotransporter-associated beta strand repeat-containing protein [Nitratireductor aquimarinus]MBY6002133.1 autotransporter-associated beta strand repeat-containing protein [Tritonibacter mobilis]MBY6024607.1 autotransporter-associated beta strand repeat-containing protein [Nitratireductor sp. DP7N14-4]
MKIKTLSSGRVSSGAEAITKRRLWASTALVAFSVVAVVGHGRAQEIIDGSMETVDGDGTGTKPSPWLLPGSLILGDQSAGMLILQNGGLASATDVQLGARASGEGQLWLHGSVADRGVLETGQVSVGAGGGTISFDGGILRLTRDEADLFAGFDDGDIRIGYSNAYIDTQEHSVATSVGLEGVGGLLKRGSGTLTLTGHNRYQSGTTVYEGVLAVDGGSITHTAGHVVVAASGGDDASLIISNGGVVSGYNSQIGWGSGTTGKALVTGAGSSWLSAGTLEIGRFGKGGLTIENGGLVESRDARIGYAQSAVGEVLVSGAGSNWRLDDGLEVGRTGKGALTIEDGGVVQSGSVFLGTNATGRGTALVSGSGTHWEVDGNLVVGRAGEGMLEISEGALVSADRVELGMFSNASGTLRLSGAAGARGVLETEQVSETSGEGSLIFDGGVLRLTANQYNLFAGFEAGDVTISAGGAYIDTHGFSVHSAYALGGSGGLIKQGNGSLTLHGANTHTGGTIVEAGTLVLKGGDALADTGAVELQGGVLRLDDDETIGSLAGVAGAHISLQANTLFTGGSGNSSVLASSISGTGGFEKQGAGTLVYTGDGSGFDGTTRVVDGALIVGVGGNGALGGAVEVLNGGVLGGSGDLGALTVASGGVLKPGNSIGTQSVSGNATFENGSVFEVEVDNAGSGDRLAVSGHAFINGGTVNVRAENGTDDGSTYDPATTYTILTATGGVSGAFSGVTENFAFLDAALAYDPDAVLLTLSRNDTDFSELAKTHNQRVAAIGAQGLGSGNQLFDAILGLSDAQAPGAFDAISGEIYGSIRSGFIADSSFCGTRLRSASGVHSGSGCPHLRRSSGAWVSAPGRTFPAMGTRRNTRMIRVGCCWGATPRSLAGIWGSWRGTAVHPFARQIELRLAAAITTISASMVDASGRRSRSAAGSPIPGMKWMCAARSRLRGSAMPCLQGMTPERRRALESWAIGWRRLWRRSHLLPGLLSSPIRLAVMRKRAALQLWRRSRRPAMSHSQRWECGWGAMSVSTSSAAHYTGRSAGSMHLTMKWPWRAMHWREAMPSVLPVRPLRQTHCFWRQASRLH